MSTAGQQPDPDHGPERAAKRQNSSPGKDGEAQLILCTTCEAELGPDDNGDGYTCSYCGGACEVHRVCADCLCDRGFVCSTCAGVYGYDCTDGTESAQFICEECLDIYCRECGDPKPGKEGTKRCTSCQPWWQKGKPATAFCKHCGSQRSDAKLCSKCGERVCFLCPGTTCEECEDPDFFTCEDCDYDPDVTYCDICGMRLCSECKCSCADDEQAEVHEE